ncbi:hypothetical protein [Halostreptopolyspora alba]|uniref:L-tyrosine 3-hydroxylase n=1 Tax=Halostreptopolyspora alba TaxID=2487137 RepID=A0A3N0E5N3_9ACTN|nr:hypothetical protein EFW17_16785 [Nocardiopsaceae bacterium YIM 96095]
MSRIRTVERCYAVPEPSEFAVVTPLILSLPETEPAPCARTAARHGGPGAAELRLLRRTVTGAGPDRLRAPEDPDERTRYRWMVGHHTAFAVWQSLARLLRSIAETPAPAAHTIRQAAKLYDVYSVLFLYAGSCSADRYAATVRADMTASHPAFSGQWARDYRPIPDLLRQVRARLPADLAASLTEAAAHNHQVHMAVAKKLVPDGVSLLQQAARDPGHGPSEDDHELYDAHFDVRRRLVCQPFFTAQLVRLLTQCLCDIADHGLEDPDAVPAEFTGSHSEALERFVRDPKNILLGLAETLSGSRVREQFHEATFRDPNETT